ncbi:BrnA antitoxin family protein [Amylibacter sp. SFDW26]|uniref:BrnA antitoxin family protein n=1 Tax=Amylibacter sp. SFDW26 TaxID=2652722 RepID=UPI001261815E|nr:BrnA antitoxin family protein [Amylibacter sp. SFDW26]KAB7610423.1 BrnA antitoxin family protein [Amylibacter sp. SFDW26]
MSTKEQRQAQRRHNLIAALARMQHDISDAWIDRSIPKDWNFLEVGKPIEPHKTKITMRVDSDMLRWFKKMGPNYQRRMNQVLRVYYTAMIQGLLNTHFANDESNALSSAYFDEVLDRMERKASLDTSDGA